VGGGTTAVAQPRPRAVGGQWTVLERAVLQVPGGGGLLLRSHHEEVITRKKVAQKEVITRKKGEAIS
jgi:hypothetical protein